MEIWKSDFENLMLHGKWTEGKDLKNQYFPKKLFKYRKLNKYTLDSLLNNGAWLSNPLTMNDPYECSFYIDSILFSKHQTDTSKFWDNLDMTGFYQLGYSDSDIEDVKNSAEPFERYVELMRAKSTDVDSFDLLLKISDKRMIDVLQEHREQHIKLMKSTVRLFSMSERNDSLLMWSHYSEQHQGVCIEYDLANTTLLKDNTYPALYTDQAFNATEYFLNKEKAMFMHLISSLYKAKDWQYEEEWRLTFANGLIDTDRYFKFPEPTAIYFGSQIDEVTDEEKKGILSQIIKLATKQNIPKYKMSLERNCFKMTPQEMY